MAVKRTVQSKIKLPETPLKSVEVKKAEIVVGAPNKDADERSSFAQGKEGTRDGKPTKKVCVFCTNKIEPRYTDSASLRRFVNDMGRIVPRARSGACSKHQRKVTMQIKYARHLALIPFIART